MCQIMFLFRAPKEVFILLGLTLYGLWEGKVGNRETRVMGKKTFISAIGRLMWRCNLEDSWGNEVQGLSGNFDGMHKRLTLLKCPHLS